jgi:leucine dehydrogenase
VDGAKVIATDTNPEVMINSHAPNISFVDPDEIYEVECDIFSPCSVGGILNSDTIPKLKCAGC